MGKKQGRLIVIEGIDGSGKTTQVNLLVEYLKKKGIDFEIISFPQYGKNKYVSQIQDYLSGKLNGEPRQIAELFAADRLTAKQRITDWLNKGKLVIANRYVSSSKAHLGTNIEELEYKTNGLPKPDLTILLNVDAKFGQANVQDRQGSDIHEDSINHLEKAAKIYLELSKSEPAWFVVDCMRGKQMKDKKEIHKLVVEIINDFLIN